jgi:hypothetical protein
VQVNVENQILDNQLQLYMIQIQLCDFWGPFCHSCFCLKFREVSLYDLRHAICVALAVHLSSYCFGMFFIHVSSLIHCLLIRFCSLMNSYKSFLDLEPRIKVT